MLTMPIPRSAWGCLDVQLRGGVMALNRFGSTLADVEREHILETLACCDGNRTLTAGFLDISVRCLRMKLNQFGQTAPRTASADLGAPKASAAFGHSHELMISC
jgi:Bacterial regulatory protein, Fis family